eukprot:3630535-Pleurochrysis_carterae.AAC.1
MTRLCLDVQPTATAESAEALASAAARLCAPLEGVAPAECMRNKCEMHIGFDRRGQFCCGFRLGLGPP